MNNKIVGIGLLMIVLTIAFVIYPASQSLFSQPEQQARADAIVISAQSAAADASVARMAAVREQNKAADIYVPLVITIILLCGFVALLIFVIVNLLGAMKAIQNTQNQPRINQEHYHYMTDANGRRHKISEEQYYQIEQRSYEMERRR